MVESSVNLEDEFASSPNEKRKRKQGITGGGRGREGEKNRE